MLKTKGRFLMKYQLMKARGKRETAKCRILLREKLRIKQSTLAIFCDYRLLPYLASSGCMRGGMTSSVSWHEGMMKIQPNTLLEYSTCFQSNPEEFCWWNSHCNFWIKIVQLFNLKVVRRLKMYRNASCWRFPTESGKVPPRELVLNALFNVIQ